MPERAMPLDTPSLKRRGFFGAVAAGAAIATTARAEDAPPPKPAPRR